MSKANGFLQLRRGLWEHVRNGELTHSGALVFIYMLTQADKRTGIWKGSAQCIANDLNIPKSTAKYTLRGLDGRYIKRFAVPGRHKCYPILLHKFLITQGPHVGLMLDALSSADPGALKFFKPEEEQQVVQQIVQQVGPQRIKENGEKRRNINPAPPAPVDSRHHPFLEFAFAEFEQRHSQKPTWGGKDFKALSVMLASNKGLGSEELQRRFRNYLDSTEPFTRKQGGSLAYFCTHVVKLPPISPSETPKPSVSPDALIREWLFRFGVEHKEDIGLKFPLWREAFGGMDPAILQPLFEKALKSCRFFPKISDILEPLQAVKEAALPEEASAAWQKVLSIRREHSNPDFPQYLARAVAQLPERVQRAARASGVFQEVSDPDQLHIWAKKRFVESYLAWDEIEENQHLLPDGPIKDMFRTVAELKSLQGATPEPEKRRRLLAERADEVSSAEERAKPSKPHIPSKSCEDNWKVEREELRKRQAQRVRGALSTQPESPCLAKAQADAFVRSCIASREGPTLGGPDTTAKEFSQR